MKLTEAQLDARARQLRLILLDVDGVLTDGSVRISAAGDESKAFSIRDGAALVWAMQAGLEIGWLSGRASGATTRRAAELGINLVIQGVADKEDAYLRLRDDRGLQDEQMAYMGDDLIDVPVLRRAGLSAAPADACHDVRERVHFVTSAAGGRGAVREFLDLVLRGRADWHTIRQRYLHS